LIASSISITTSFIFNSLELFVLPSKINSLFKSSLLSNTTGGANTAMGVYALQANTTASNNTAVGYQAAYTGTTASETTAFGYRALYVNTANSNTALG
jgi:hypothetical protein